MEIQDQYKWLLQESGPKMLLEALKLYGTHETPGTSDNPIILSWAKELGINWYTHDSIPWCGLFMGIIAKRADHPFNPNLLLSALNWVKFGTKVDEAKLGDVLVFKRTGGGHVTLYIGEDDQAYHCLGGNQSDQVNIERIAKSRIYSIQRPPYEVEPINIRKIILNSTGKLSTNEA